MNRFLAVALFALATSAGVAAWAWWQYAHAPLALAEPEIVP